MKKKNNLILVLILTLSFHPAYSFSIDEKLANHEMELRAMNLFKIIRCLICSGESIYESQSQLAYDMRSMIRSKIQNGYDDNQIITELRNNYGNQITVIPPYNSYTYLLWVLPTLVLITGTILIVKLVYQRK